MTHSIGFDFLDSKQSFSFGQCENIQYYIRLVKQCVVWYAIKTELKFNLIINKNPIYTRNEFKFDFSSKTNLNYATIHQNICKFEGDKCGQCHSVFDIFFVHQISIFYRIQMSQC